MSNSEKELIRKAKNGDVYSFEKLIKDYQINVYNLAFRILGNKEDAYDVSQEAFIKVYKSIKNFKEESSFSTWLYRLVSNTCLDYLKKNKKVKTLNTTISSNDNQNIDLQIKDNSRTPDEVLETKEEIDMLISALNELSEQHRVVIVLRDIQGFSYSEISKVIKCSEGTVKSRLNRARWKLKDIIARKKEHLT